MNKSINLNESDHYSKIVPELDVFLKEQIMQIPGAIEYVEKLQRTLKQLVKKIRKLKNKISNKEKYVEHAFTQTEIEDVIYKYEATNDKETDNESKSVAEDIKEAAEQAMQNMGFVFEATSGMYYDYNTGYYYNSEYGLYYDSKTGTYFNYNADKNEYEFHSQVSVEPSHSQNVEVNTTETPRKNAKKKRKAINSVVKVNTSSGLADLTSSFNKMNINNLRHNALEIAKQWPPCMRIIVEASEVPSIQIGSLHVITLDGGTLGREGNHSILIPDLNISKHHLKFQFDKDAQTYNVIDLGSRNGTLLNGKRMTPSKQESDPMEVTHGSKIQVGSTVLLCHIHNGNHTCTYCEPGLTSVVEKEGIVLRPNRSESHKNELKKLKKIYGIARQEPDIKLAQGYTDRAQKRREDIGSQNPHEKTQVASVDETISKENKGFKLLSKMGWKEGQSLGKTGEDGLLEPVKASSNVSGAGLGSSDALEKLKTTKKTKIWAMTKERFRKLPDVNNAFEESSD